MSKPILRLKGFEGEWKGELLSKIATMHARIGWQNLRKDEFLSKGEYYLITGTDFVEGRVDYKTCHFVERERYDQDKNIQIKNGSILITKDGTLGKVAFVENLNKPATLNAGVFNIMCKTNNVDSRYLFQYLRSPLLMNYVNSTATGGTIKHLNQNILVNFPVQLPTIEEQTFLGTYFQHLDNIVQNVIKKIALLKQMKSASLISMFPQNGETKPRVRFKGFDGDWVKKLLSECLDISKERNTDDKYGKDDVLSVSDDFGVMNQIELLGRSYAGKSVSNYGILKQGQLVYTKSPLKSKPYGIVKENIGKTGIVSVLYAIYTAKENTWIPFIHYYFDPAWRLNAYLRPLINKGAKNTMNISDETALTGYIMIPDDIKEQQRIASFFRSLDKQISLQELRLEKLKQIKAACLDKMFV